MAHHMARWSSGLRLRPLTPATRVRISYGSPLSVPMAVGVHPFPSRTRQLSPLAPKILGWKRPGKIGRRRHACSSLAQSVEHAAVNRRVVGSSPTGGATSSAKGKPDGAEPSAQLVSMAVGVHPFPSRTRQLSPLASKILGWKRPGKIDRCQHEKTRLIRRVFSMPFFQYLLLLR